ncbi:molybdenum-dependent oxidoreductase-like protein [Pseudonocardia endophytica]|uniref:Molybdenum-dependent oxidoreductase-like protein n=2 Tax=Pseudonocardia endophytica TaxID=401976 RepID=A0A4R1HYQ6_PSEEN|nr:molybdenum-dependent oxidoreductase-like protein [Pseudonocardia endophytica]
MTGPSPVKWQPPSHHLDPRYTAAGDVYLIGHLGVAQIDPAGWRLRVDGLVDTPLEIGLDDLRAMGSEPVTATLECFGNPLDPEVPVRRVANLRWRGVPVRTVLERAGVRPGATSVWATGLDHGEFAGEYCTEYRKDLPLDVVLERGLLAHELDDGPLPAERGYPVRLVVPGFFGTNNVKWLGRLTLADHRPEHLFTTRLYLRPSPDGMVPVREMDVNSLLTAPADGADVDSDVEVAGWAWGFEPVARVEVAVDGRWGQAEVEPRAPGPPTWQRFRARRVLVAGAHEIAVRATDRAGVTQPLDAARNAVHRVRILVR